MMTKNLLLTVTLIILMTSEFTSGAKEGKKNTGTACAACRNQRRRCTDNCVFRPYFPADKPEVLLNVHRLYGLTTFSKMLKKLDTPGEKDDFAKSVIYEATVRSVSPVYGSHGVIWNLRNQIDLTEHELQSVKNELSRFRSIVSSSSFNPYAAGYFPLGSTNPSLNPYAASSSSTPYVAAESFSPGSTHPSQNHSVNDNYYFPRIAVADGRNQVFYGGAYPGGPLQNPNANAIPHTVPSDQRLYLATGNVNDNNYENALGSAVTDHNQAIGVSTGDFADGGLLRDANADANIFMPTDSNDLRFHQQGMGDSTTTTTPNKGKEIQIDDDDYFSAAKVSWDQDKQMQSFMDKYYGFHGQGGDSMKKNDDDDPFL